jgi:hypothetical protein
MPDAEAALSVAGAEVESLTIQAWRAAEQGDWDTVEQCVNRRGALLEQAGLPALPVERLVALDRRIQASALAAKAAVAAILMELAQTKRNLRRLHGETGSSPEPSRFMNITA